MINYYVYYLTDSLTNQPFYVGKGSGSRMYQHVREAQREDYAKRSVHSKIKNILQNGGEVMYQKFDMETEEAAFTEERRLIQFHGRKDLGTGILHNLTEGGEGALNVCPESIERRAEKHRGMKRSEAARLNMRKAQQKLRQGGMQTSAETRERMKSRSKHRPNQTEETKRRRQLSTKKIAILQYDVNKILVREWESLSAAARGIGTKPSSILSVCNGSAKTHRGCIWEKRDNEKKVSQKRWVLQFLLDGASLVKQYKTTKLAESETGCGFTSIIKCCNGTLCTAGGFIWRYGEEITPALNIVQIDPETSNIIRRFSTILEAALHTGVHKSLISNCVNKRPHYNTAGGFGWDRLTPPAD